MTPEERNVLLPLLDKLKETNVSEKDAEADQLIHQTLASKPDAAYILAQTVLMQDFALHQAQDTIQKLKTQAQSAPQQSSGSGGFLGGLFGGHSTPAPAQSQPQYQQAQYSQPQASPWGQRPMQSSPYAQPMMAAVQPGSSGQPSFLRNAAQTAAGVAGGALLFDGISSLFGGHGGGFGGGMGGGGFGGGSGFGQPVENVDNHEVINNYYDQPASDNDMGVQGGDSNDYVDNAGGIDTSTGDDSDFGL